VNPPYAVAGADIEPGMTIVLEPGGDPFVVTELRPAGDAVNWRRVSSAAGNEGLLHLKSWYAAAVS
jgi:hypothetical protein